MKSQKYVISFLFVAVLFSLLLASSFAFAATFQVRRGEYVAQDNPRWREVIPAEDMDAHNVTWSGGSRDVRFFPSWEWQNPQLGDQLCWLYDSNTYQVWWNSGMFNQRSTDIWVQLDGCDQNDGDAEIYVDSNLVCTVNTTSNPMIPIAILITGLSPARHTVEIRTKTNNSGDVSIDYVALPKHGKRPPRITKQEHFENDTCEDAFDLTSILLGKFNITHAINQPFKKWIAFNPPGLTVIHWSGGVVRPGEKAGACFKTEDDGVPPVIVAFWTGANGKFIGLAGVKFCLNPFISSDANGVSRLMVRAANTWRDWIADSNDVACLPDVNVGPGYPPQPSILVDNFYYAIVDHPYDLNELDPNFVTEHPEISWTQIAQPFTLTADNIDPNLVTKDFDLGQIEAFDMNKVMIIRAESEANITYPPPCGTKAVRSREMVQFQLSDLLYVPISTAGDLDGDSKVNYHDFAPLAEDWLKCYDPYDPNCLTYSPFPSWPWW